LKKDIRSRIYNAQCIGNVEPIEYMTPYPSMRSLMEGQTIKFSDQVIIEKFKITNLGFFSLVQQTSNWLESIGVKPRQRVIIPKLTNPQSEVLLFGVWNLGASAVFSHDLNITEVKRSCENVQALKFKTDLFKEIESFPDNFKPKYKPLLSDEAILTFEKGLGIRLSHYNLLVNVNGIQKAIRLKSRTRFHSNLKIGSACWVIFQVILPFYCGCIKDENKPEMVIGTSDSDYNLRHDLKNIKKFSHNDIGICLENTAALCIEKKPIHLSDYEIIENGIQIKGHSVMMGYLDDKINEAAFNNDNLNILF